jgi:hypothetical protein
MDLILSNLKLFVGAAALGFVWGVIAYIKGLNERLNRAEFDKIAIKTEGELKTSEERIRNAKEEAKKLTDRLSIMLKRVK